MTKQKVIAGVDVSGSTRDVPWITTAVVEGNNLRLKSCEPIRRENLTRRLLDLCNDASNTNAVVAMDFPFGVPDEFAKERFGLANKETLKRFGFPDEEMPDLSEAQMPERWEAICKLGNLPAYIKYIRTFLKKDGESARFRTLPRKWDKKQFDNKAFAPLAKSSPIDMFPMTFYGMKMLHELWTKTKCRVPPLDCPNRTGPELLETMPGVVLDALGLESKGYKTNKGINTLDNLKTRKSIVEQLRETCSMELLNFKDYRDLCIFNDDALDSIVAAVVAALWACDKEKTLFHRPEDPKHSAVLAAVKREGGIYAPKRTQK